MKGRNIIQLNRQMGMVEIPILLIFIILVIGGVWYYATNIDSTKHQSSSSANSSPTPLPKIISEYEYKTYDEITIDPSVPLLDKFEPTNKYLGVNKYGQNLVILTYETFLSQIPESKIAEDFRKKLIAAKWEIQTYQTNTCPDTLSNSICEDWGYLIATDNISRVTFNTGSYFGTTLEIVTLNDVQAVLTPPSYFPSPIIKTEDIESIFTVHEEGIYQLIILTNLTTQSAKDIGMQIINQGWNEDCGFSSASTGSVVEGCGNHNSFIKWAWVTNKHHPVEQVLFSYSTIKDPSIGT